MKQQITLVGGLVCSLLFGSCQQQEDLRVVTSSEKEVEGIEVPTDLFVESLSKAISESQELRSFLTERALVRFDNNTDVLYHQIKNTKLQSGSTVRELILSHWSGSAEEFGAYESANPLLNIHAVDMSLLDHSLDPDAWDLSSEVAVAQPLVSGKGIMYVGGKQVAILDAGEVPAVPTLVVNQNKRVKVVSSLRALDGTKDFGYAFTDELYDGSKVNREQLRHETYVQEAPDIDEVPASELDPELIAAYEKVNPEDQRANIYYGNPNLHRGAFNELLYRFRLELGTYDNITGRFNREPSKEASDPQINVNGVKITYKGRNASLDEVIADCWTSGVFSFSFEVLTPEIGGTIKSQQIIVPVYPKQLFVMNVDRERRHPTMFRSTQYKYRIHPDRIEPRWVYPGRILHGRSDNIRLSGFWDLSLQSVSKEVRISELDEGKEIREKHSVTSEFVVAGRLSSDFGIIKDGKIGASLESQSKVTKVSETEVTYKDGDDNLGTVDLYFHDPVIIGRGKLDKNNYLLRSVSSGSVVVTFIPAKYR